MRAMTVVPGCRDTAAVETLDEPPDAQGELLVSGRLVGVCGTDREIAEGVYGEPPQGESRLVLGHEGLGEVLEAPVGSGFERGDLVVGIVRRAFGEADRGTLFVTTGREQLDAQAVARQPDAGRVFRVSGLGTRGPGCNLYRGSLTGLAAGWSSTWESR